MVCPHPELLGVYSDAALSRAWGVSAPTVRRWRRARGTPPAEGHYGGGGRKCSPAAPVAQVVRPTEKKVAVLTYLECGGGMSDAQIARLVGTGRQYVRVLRLALAPT